MWVVTTQADNVPLVLKLEVEGVAPDVFGWAHRGRELTLDVEHNSGQPLYDCSRMANDNFTSTYY